MEREVAPLVNFRYYHKVWRDSEIDKRVVTERGERVMQQAS